MALFDLWQWGKDNAISSIFPYISISCVAHYFVDEHCDHVTAQKWSGRRGLTLIIFYSEAAAKSMAIQ